MSTKTDRASVERMASRLTLSCEKDTKDLLLALLAERDATEGHATANALKLTEREAELGQALKQRDDYRSQLASKCFNLAAAEAALDAYKVDAERMDWLQKEFEAHGCLKFERYSVGKAGCELFTVSSQHVRGYEIRGVIDAARTIEAVAATHEAV